MNIYLWFRGEYLTYPYTDAVRLFNDLIHHRRIDTGVELGSVKIGFDAEQNGMDFLLIEPERAIHCSRLTIDKRVVEKMYVPKITFGRPSFDLEEELSREILQPGVTYIFVEWKKDGNTHRTDRVLIKPLL
jgi:hypothetical protein